jgi:hypothetical protein
MQKYIGKMIAPGVRAPDKIIQPKGNVLHWPIVRGELGEEVMPKAFREEQRAFKERIYADEIFVIP